MRFVLCSNESTSNPFSSLGVRRRRPDDLTFGSITYLPLLSAFSVVGGRENGGHIAREIVRTDLLCESEARVLMQMIV